MIRLYKPEYDDLSFRRDLLSDEETMSYNHAWGGTIPFPEEDWADWYACWVADPGKDRFYRYILDERGAFIGEIAYRYDGELGGCAANVIVHARYRGKGYGGRALEALCAAAKDNGVGRLYDDIAADNPAAGMFLRRGFSEVGRTKDKIILMKEL